MDEERFNQSLRKLLKEFGITAQREVEKAVWAALETGTLRTGQALKAQITMAVEGLPAPIQVDGRIELG
jgi:spore coat protein CotF